MSMAGARRDAAGTRRMLVFIPARRYWPGGGRGTPGATTALTYLLLDAGGGVTAGVAPLAQLPRARAVDLVFDSLDVYTTTLEVPRLGEVRLRQALPNLLEERMLADAADSHFAWNALPGPAGADTQRLAVSAIPRSTLTRVLDAFQQAGLEPQAAYSELYTLAPPAEGKASVRIAAARALVRTGADQAIALDLEDGADTALGLALHQSGVRVLRVHGDAGGTFAALAAKVGALLEPAAEPLAVDALDGAVNLLQGPYASASGFGATGRWAARVVRSGAWRAPAAWLGACTVLFLVGLNAYWLKLDGQYRAVRDSMQHAFRDAFPTQPTIVDAVAQARNLVAGQRARAGRPSAEDFSVMNAQALELMASAPPGIVSAIDYGDGAYVLHLRTGAWDSNPELRNALQARAVALGLELRMDPDGGARLTPKAN